MNYHFKEFKGFKYPDGSEPIDVYYRTVYIGTLGSKMGKFSIKVVDGPTEKINIKSSESNLFITKKDAAEVLHYTWKLQRKGK